MLEGLDCSRFCLLMYLMFIEFGDISGLRVDLMYLKEEFLFVNFGSWFVSLEELFILVMGFGSIMLFIVDVVLMV